MQFPELYTRSLNLFLLHLHFDIWVRVAISVHGSQVDTAYNTHEEAILLGAVHEGDQDPAALLNLSAFFPRLRQRTEDISERRVISLCKNSLQEFVMFRHAWK